MGQKFCNKDKAMKVDKIRWTETKIVLNEGGRTQKQIAEFLKLGESTVQRINSTRSFEEYQAVSKAQHTKKVVTDTEKRKWKFWKWAS